MYRIQILTLLRYERVFTQLMLILWFGWSVCKYVCMKVRMYVWKSRLVLFICNSGTILWNFVWISIQGMPSFYLFTTFTSEVKQMWNMYKYAIKHHLSSVSPETLYECYIEYAVILPFHDFHLRGQTNVAYVFMF